MVSITSDASGNESPSRMRLVTARDAVEIAAIRVPYVTDSVSSFESEPPTVEEMHLRIEGTLERYPWLICVERRKLL